MKNHGNVTLPATVTADAGNRNAALAAAGWGLAGVVAFALTLPMTRLAVLGGMDAATVGIGRAVVAAGLAALLLAVTRQRLPPVRQLRRLAVVALGVVIGFPLLSSLAMALVPAGHAAVIVGLLPAATAAMAVLRAGERPSPAFWLSALAGLAAVLAFATARGASGHPEPADLLVLAAVLLAALGYAEGAVLSRELGGWRVISWALVVALPVTLPATLLLLWWRLPAAPPTAGAWAGFAYVAAVSMFLGFFAWYRGLARGGVARIGQLQLAQPVLTLLASALLLGEALTPAALVAAAVVLLCTLATQRARIRR
ncbi:MAG: DMT family transporter [Geminicoccaceae bacterium]